MNDCILECERRWYDGSKWVSNPYKFKLSELKGVSVEENPVSHDSGWFVVYLKSGYMFYASTFPARSLECDGAGDFDPRYILNEEKAEI